MPRQTVDELLAAARQGLARLEPAAAKQAQDGGAYLVDVRTTDQLRRDGRIPGAVEVSLNVLEWRLDPTSDSRLPEAPGLEQMVIVLCNQGYCSSLAAARLMTIGFARATDVVGGFEAWQAAGLPIVPAGPMGAPGPAAPPCSGPDAS